MHPVVSQLENRLIVSCQAYPGEPMRDPRTMAQVAAAVVSGGAAAVRIQGLDDIRHTRNAVDVPIIGLWKDGHDGVFITPTLNHCRKVLANGADIIALDGTARPRPDGLSFAETVARLREITDAPVMADCDDVASAMTAAECGVDIVGTTLAGYTGTRPKTDGPDLELLAELSTRLEGSGCVLIAEGRIHAPAQARECRDAGAFAVVVGTAITHPASITGWFCEALT